MTSNSFAKATSKILASENLLQDIRDNANLVDQTLLSEHQNFVSSSLQNYTFQKAKTFETTDEVDSRVKAMNKLDERLKSFKKEIKKQLKRTDYQCQLHCRSSDIQLSDLLNNLMERDQSMTDIATLVKNDADILEQHVSNMEKMTNFISSVKSASSLVEEQILPAAEVVNDAISLLFEIDKDIDYLNESKAMYNGLSNDAPTNPFEKEINKLTDML